MPRRPPAEAPRGPLYLLNRRSPATSSFNEKLHL